MKVEIVKGIIVGNEKIFKDRIWYEFVNSNRYNESDRGCYWMVLE